MNIIFMPSEVSIEANPSENLLDVASKAGIMIEASCGRLGTCGKCKVKLLAGNDGKLDQHEISYLSKDEIQNGMRLACRVATNLEMTVLVPGTNSAQFRKTKMGVLPLDFEEFVEQKQQENRENSNEKFGIAFDIGTTTVVSMLWNLSNYKLISVSSRTNPQGSYGGDVISRINFANQSKENLETLRDKICSCLNDMVSEFVNGKKLDIEKLSEITIVGNTTMSHLLLAVSPESLARAPFEPAFYKKDVFNPREILIDAPGSVKVTLLPNIAGHVGSDIVGVILASRIREKKGINIAIDIGTNGEIVISDNGKAYGCSTAAGPAFEGVSIGIGMRASTGAIEGVSIYQGEVVLKVIDEVSPHGICGSGLIDAISEMLKMKLINFTGRLIDQEGATKLEIDEKLVNRLRTVDGSREFVLAYAKDDTGKDIVITQKDIREVQLAKGAIFSGIKILLLKCGKQIEDIDAIFVAGAFGNYISKESAVRIGLLPDIGIEKIVSIGNAACTGAFMTLLDEKEMRKAFEIYEKVEHVELATYEGFQDEYVSAMNFPKL